MSAVSKRTAILLVLWLGIQGSSGMKNKVTFMTGSAAVTLPTVQLHYLNIYHAVTVTAPGTLVAWEFVAMKTGTIIFGLWEYIGHNEYRLHNKTYITVTKLGKQVFTIPEDERYQALVGHMVGVHSLDHLGGGIIPMTTNDCCGLQIGMTHAYQIFDSEIPVGYLLSYNPLYHERTIAVLLYIEQEPIIEMTSGDPRVLADDTPGSCIQIPPGPPGMLKVRLDYQFPLPDLRVNVTLRNGGCEQVYVYIPRKTGVSEKDKLHQLCNKKPDGYGIHTLCRFSCLSGADKSSSEINVRIHQLSRMTASLCLIEID